MSNVPSAARVVSGIDGLHGARRHLPGLTSLRGIAAWWVVLFHFKEFIPSGVPGWMAGAIGRGYLAVDLFFVLSGFIIAYNYLRLFQPFDIRTCLRFLGIRLARIYPLHLFMLAIFLINPLAIAVAASRGIDQQRYDAVYYVYSLLLVQNWGFTSALAWNVPAWSISTEWFAYLCFPLLAWIASRSTRGPMLTVACIVLPLAILAIALDTVGIPLGGDIPSNGLTRCIFEFTAGIFLYRLWQQADINPAYYSYAAVVFVLLLGCYLGSVLDEQCAMPAIWACVVFMLANKSGAIVNIGSNHVLETIGEWSYSTYLCHYFVRDWVKFLLIGGSVPPWVTLACYLTATLAMSALLYRFVELPGRGGFRRLVDRAVPPRHA